MMTEIKRNTWSQFCRKFNATNQLRPALVQVRHNRQRAQSVDENMPFMGLTITKKGRLINGIELFVARTDPNHIAEPVVTVKEPARIILEKDTRGIDGCLTIESKDGTIASVRLTGNRSEAGRRAIVEKVAYSMFEGRGYLHGGDFSDWLEAERRVEETEAQFV